MRKAARKNDGFTLIELIVTIVTASIVTLAATTILLLGMRINRQSIDTASRQSTTRILLTALEELATEGMITGVEYGPDSWRVIGENDTALFSYDSEKQTVFTGDYGQTPLLENVIASFVELQGQLLTFSVETEDGSYSSSVYCRTTPVNNDIDNTGDTMVDNITDGDTSNDDLTIEGNAEIAGRTMFLKALASQYTIETSQGKLRNPGLILNSDGVSTGEYFSQWYVGSYETNPGWNSQTPWCACFISWGLMNQELVDFGTNTRGFANVDTFMSYLKNNNADHKWISSSYYGGTQAPSSGDLIFFDWTINGVQNPEHIGAVIKVSEEEVNGQTIKFVYTIEGNSAGRVAVRKYRLSDPRIIGYGVLNWKTST